VVYTGALRHSDINNRLITAIYTHLKPPIQVKTGYQSHLCKFCNGQGWSKQNCRCEERFLLGVLFTPRSNRINRSGDCFAALAMTPVADAQAVRAAVDQYTPVQL
jgi:hypothetical protein